ncbi:MAG: siderophore-interacting protein [Nocardioides sp.]
MSSRAEQYVARVVRRTHVAPHLVRLTLGGAGLAGFASTGIADEWVGLVVPGQFQSRYYTVRRWSAGELELDVVVHDEGLVTAWAARDCVGDDVTVTAPRGSFDPPPGAGWLLLVGDLTALPAMARIAETTSLPTRVWAEVPDDPAELAGYLPERVEVTWLPPSGPGASDLAGAVAAIDWPPGEGYLWMAGESGQMRAVRKHLRHDRRLPSTQYDVMGYWRVATRRPRAVDPQPIWRAGLDAGLTDEQIWAAYDRAQDAADRPAQGPR